MLNIIFVHPDLGIGGAERLIVDAAVALKQKGHSVHILTAHHDTNHCFEETKDGTISVTVLGDWLPRNLFGYCYALCAYLRMVFVSLCLLFWKSLNPDVIIIDQVSIPIPILKWKTSNIIFYCHFPDQLLSTPGGSLKNLYRKPLNWLEEYTTNKAKKIFVNSKFTLEIFLKTFPSAKRTPDVLYPSLAIKKFDNTQILALDEILPSNISDDPIILVSLNRFERKKNIALAIKAFKILKNMLSPLDWEKCHLVVAGGYDEILLENVEHFIELRKLVDVMDLNDKVTMLKSPSDQVKISLLKLARCLIYTPINEHFGIVPTEAMYLQTPVLAVDSGGPTESVLDGGTGFLRDPTPEAFANALCTLVQNKALADRMGDAGRIRVRTRFSFQEFSRQLDNAVKQCIV